MIAYRARLITRDETWLYHYDPETNNSQRSSGIAAHPAPKISYCKNPLENFSPRFFGIKTASSSLIIFQSAKFLTRSITHLCWCNWRTFWGKNAAGISPKGSCSCTTLPRLTGHLQRRRNWPTLDSNVLNSYLVKARPAVIWSWDFKNIHIMSKKRSTHLIRNTHIKL
jgi:hypothetical protein